MKPLDGITVVELGHSDEFRSCRSAPIALNLISIFASTRC